MPIRLKVFLPVFLSTCTVLFVALFMVDPWLKNQIESICISLAEARCDVGGLELSFRNSSLRIRKLEIASKDDEFKNAIEFADIDFDFQALPLLEKRVVVDDFSIRGVAFGTPRRRSGKISPARLRQKPSWAQSLLTSGMEAIEKEFRELPVGKIIDFQIPTNPREIVEAMKLESLEVYKQTLVQQQELRSSWALKLAELKDTREWDSRMEDLRSFAKSPSSEPSEILERIEKAKETFEYLSRLKKKVDDFNISARGDLAKIQMLIDNSQKSAEADLQKARQSVNLDQLNIGNFSRLLFGLDWVHRADQVLRYQRLLREVLAKKKEKDAESVLVEKRARGRDIVFLSPDLKPSFVLENSEFSLKSLTTELNQSYEMKMTGINSAPRLYGKPSTLDFVGKFKGLAIGEASFSGLWDYTKEPMTDKYEIKLNKIDANTWPVGIPLIFPLEIEKGLADVRSEFSAEGEAIVWTSQIQFKDVSWDFSKLPKHGMLIAVLQNVFQKVKDFELVIRFIKKGGQISLGFESDMDAAVRDGIIGAMDKKLKEFEERLRREIEGRISTFKKAAAEQIPAFQNEVIGTIDMNISKLSKYSEEARQIEEDLKKRTGRSAVDQIKKNLPPISNPFQK